MIEFYRNGQFPVNKISKFFKADEVDTAVHSMHDGTVIKPILIWR